MRLFLDQRKTYTRPPMLELVKANEEGGCKSVNLKALGSAQVDGWAKQAAHGADAEYLPQSRNADAAQVHDATGTWIIVIAHAVSQCWWEQPRTTGGSSHVACTQMGRNRVAYLQPSISAARGFVYSAPISFCWVKCVLYRPSF